MNIIAIKMALLGAAIAAPLTGAVALWLAQPPRPPAAVRVIFETRIPQGPSEPQFNSGDPQFVIDPDDGDAKSPNRSCNPGDEDCDDEPDEPADRVLHT